MSTYIQFGSGLLWFNPISGNLAVNPTPTRGLTIQDVEIDFSADLKELRGQKQYPDDVAKGDIKSTFKFGVGRVDLNFLNQCYFADTVSAGGVAVSESAVTAIPATPFMITPTFPGSGTFATDLGVRDANSGFEFARVTGTPTAGQYAVTAGVYLFSSADHVSGISVIISSSYTVVSAGATYQVNNQVMGYGPAIELYISNKYQLASGVPNSLRLYQAKIGKCNIKEKRADYTMIDVDGSFYANSADAVAAFYSNNG